jgi:hypothetical protein
MNNMTRLLVFRYLNETEDFLCGKLLNDLSIACADGSIEDFQPERFCLPLFEQ